MELVSPSLELKSSFLSMYKDFTDNDPENSKYYSEAMTSFSSYVQRLHDETQGVNLREGYVPCSHFWLVDPQKNILGVIRIRHNIIMSLYRWKQVTSDMISHHHFVVGVMVSTCLN